MAQRSLDGERGGPKEVAGVGDQLEAHGLELSRGHERGGAPLDHVRDQRNLEGLTNLAELIRRGWRFNEQGVGSSRLVGSAALNRRLDSFDRSGIGPCND